VQPLPEVHAVARQLTALSEDTVDLLESLRAVSDLAAAALPSCVGVSITVLVDGEPFTVTATSADAGTVDAMQYLDDGPCVQASRIGEAVRVPDVLDEQLWQAFAESAAVYGIRSSLSVPLQGIGGSAVGALNLYSSDRDAFSQADPLLIALFGTHVEGAVRNADLGFATREAARRLPEQLADRATTDQAVGVMMANRGCSAPEARERIEWAARHAGISVKAAADMVIQIGT
jgi:GAF domain-containing protein